MNYRKTPALRRILFGIYFSYKTNFFSRLGGRLKGGVFIHWIIVKTILKGFLYKTDFFPKLGGRLKGGVVLKVGFYGSMSWWKDISLRSLAGPIILLVKKSSVKAIQHIPQAAGIQGRRKIVSVRRAAPDRV